MELWQLWICQNWVACVGQHYSYQSDRRGSRHLGPPQTPSATLWDYCHKQRWKMEMQTLCTASHWDEAWSLLTRPRPSPCIFTPTSIDYAVGGRAASSVFPPVPRFQHRHGLPRLMLCLLAKTVRFPLTAAFVDVLSSGPDIINDDCHPEWDIFLKETPAFIVSSPTISK